MKQFITFFALMFSYMLCGAQATTLVVDNQTPGWLSSRINYGDQQTVENLTVSGFLNPTDLKFLGTMISSHSLSKNLDISNCQVVDAENNLTNVLPSNAFGLSYSSEHYGVGYKLDKLSLPITMADSPSCLYGVASCPLVIDKLTCGGENCQSITKKLGAVAKNVIVRHGVQTIKCSIANEDSIISLALPETTIEISANSFKNCKNLSEIKLPNSITTIGENAFYGTAFLPDTLNLPTNLILYNTTAFPLKKNQVVIIHRDVKEICNTYDTYNNMTNIYSTHDYISSSYPYVWYIENPTPPKISSSPKTYHKCSENCLKSSTLYIPKGSYNEYSTISPYKNAKIVELIPIESLSFSNDAYDYYVGDTFKITPIITPLNSTNQTLNWESSNPNIASISSDGIITALAYGTTIIKVSDLEKCHTASFSLSIFEHVKNISLPQNLNLNIGGKAQLTATIYPVGKTDGNLVWYSSDTDIVTVDETGNVKGVSKGTCNITTTSVDGNHAATCIVNVIQPVESIFLSSNELSVTVGENKVVVATVLPSNANNKEINWRSADESVATVDNNGRITAIDGGVVEILASSVESPEIKDKCIVTVIQPAVGININKSVLELTADDSERLIVSIIPDNTTNKSVNWTSSDVSVAMVSADGTVYAIKPGQATIMATTVDGGFVALCKVTVKAKVIVAESLTLSKTTANLTVGETLQLSANVLPENTTNKDIRWTSTNTDIAVVAETGLVSAAKEGNAQIIASTTDGSNLSAICEVSVNSRFVAISQIAISPSTVRLAVGENLNLQAQITPADATNKNINWSTTNPSVVTVDSNGQLTAKGIGTATIIASSQDGSNISASSNVEVFEPTVLVSAITIDPYSITGKVGETYQLTATIAPENASEKSLVWSTDNLLVASVDSSGLITLLNKGNAIITGAATDGSGAAATCAVFIDENSGNNNIEIAHDEYVRIYNMQGILVYEGVYSESRPASGTYIIISRGNSIRKTIR